jgi:hypothetical protein
MTSQHRLRRVLLVGCGRAVQSRMAADVHQIGCRHDHLQAFEPVFLLLTTCDLHSGVFAVQK